MPDAAPEILAAGLVAQSASRWTASRTSSRCRTSTIPPSRGGLYLHAAHVSRLIGRLQSGDPVCVTVTIVDGLVYSRTAKYHSMNYRSVVCFARAAADEGDRGDVLAAMVARYFPGREAGRDYEAAPSTHLDATGFVALEIEEWSAKARTGGPNGPRDSDPDAPGSAGVVQISAF